MRLAALVSMCCLFLCCAPIQPVYGEQAPPHPDIFLWAWQRAEDLRFLNPRKFGVAYMACRSVLADDNVVVEYRTQPMHVAQETVLLPAVRIDVSKKHAPTYSDKQLRELAKNIVNIAHSPRSSGVQIDFDARLSERTFYRKLIALVRSELPASLPLSITALASWCLFDDWIRDLPIDEAVPMMFSLGSERQQILTHFLTGRDLLDSRARGSLGISLEDKEMNALMLPLLQSRKMPTRLYAFTRTAWNQQKVQALENLLERK